MWELLQYDFMQRAFAAGIIIALIAPLIGLFLVVRRYSYLSDTLAHVSLVGVALGLIARLDPIWTALGVATLASWGIEKLRSTKRLFGESVLSIFLSGSLAIALLLMGAYKRFNQDLLTYLFGSITTVTTQDVWVIFGLGVITLIITVLIFKELFLVSLNEELAEAEGLRVSAYNYIIITLAAAVIVLSMRIVGALLVGALMVIPVSTAMQFRVSFRKTAFIALTVSLLATLCGLVISFYLDVPTGATIVIVALLALLGSIMFNRK